LQVEATAKAVTSPVVAVPAGVPWLKLSQPSTTAPGAPQRTPCRCTRSCSPRPDVPSPPAARAARAARSEREPDAAGDERQEAAGAVAPTPASEPHHEPVTNVTTSSPRERLDDQQVGRTVARGVAGGDKEAPYDVVLEVSGHPRVIASGATLLSPMKPLPLGQVVSTGAAARGVDSTEHRPRRAARSEPCSILRRPTIGSRSPARQG
jgi:hypothetical protein